MKDPLKPLDKPLETRDLAHLIEHTLLGQDIDEKRMMSHLSEALKLDVLGVCVPLSWVPLAKKHLSSKKKIVVTVVDFPYGRSSPEEKAKEAIVAKMLGADEIDMVLDYEALIAKEYKKAFDGICSVVNAIKPIPIKVIVETSALNRDQLAIATALVAMSGAKFIKTSTGFHNGGARVEDISLMRSLLPNRVLIKASGGIKDQKSAMDMVNAGAARIGASRTKDILHFKQLH